MHRTLVKFGVLLSIFFQPAWAQDEQTYDVYADPFFFPIESLETLSSSRLHPSSYDPQRQQNWCWAAATATVLDILISDDVDPCRVASEALNRPCCSNPSICNQQNSIPAMRSILERYDYEISETVGQLDSEIIVADLEAGFPVTIRVAGPYGNGHFVNIVGHDHLKNHGTRRLYVVVHDPMHGYYQGSANSLGYAIRLLDLRGGRLQNYPATWTHSYRYFPKDYDD